MDVNSAILETEGKRYAFDPWGQAADWTGRNIDAVFVTHGHFDHVIGLAGTNIPWYMDMADLEIFEESHGYLATFGRKIETAPTTLSAAPKIKGMEIIKTPGHSEGSVCFYFPSEKILLTGDTLFVDTIGRTDFPGGNHETLIASLILLKSHNFPPDTLIVPGHGETATWSEVLKTNPYMQ